MQLRAPMREERVKMEWCLQKVISWPKKDYLRNIPTLFPALGLFASVLPIAKLVGVESVLFVASSYFQRSCCCVLLKQVVLSYSKRDDGEQQTA